jgi:hypothetical protein
MSEQQRKKIIGLLETAQTLSIHLQESTLAYLIERAIDEARNAASDPRKGKAPGRG